MTINDIKMSSFYLKHSNYEEVKGYLPDDVMQIDENILEYIVENE